MLCAPFIESKLMMTSIVHFGCKIPICVSVGLKNCLFISRTIRCIVSTIPIMWNRCKQDRVKIEEFQFLCCLRENTFVRINQNVNQVEVKFLLLLQHIEKPNEKRTLVSKQISKHYTWNVPLVFSTSQVFFSLLRWWQ